MRTQKQLKTVLHTEKVESPKLETFFMSEQATFSLSTIGLLGEYCPSRRKDRYPCFQLGCMHLELSQGHRKLCQDCQFMWAAPAAWNNYNPEEETFLQAHKLSLPF
ncbi:conserved peptide upstream open reading frame 19 [Striga asiatica]|uniref:Conserved peptide upstream open reading frame 19 n=1 Tax=Striga asiatica TaxID=4170 RepID=A0A5A7Q0T0_STRAF|nr:conserved peptide upstream open reading frame 19 [Striga asiatica]